MDRLRRRRPRAGLPAHLQPGAPAEALRPRRRVRAPLGARAARRARPLPRRAVDHDGDRPADGGLRDRRGLPGAHRRTRRPSASARSSATGPRRADVGHTALVLGDQLSHANPALEGAERVLLVETHASLARLPHHRQRRHLVLSRHAPLRRRAARRRRAGGRRAPRGRADARRPAGLRRRLRRAQLARHPPLARGSGRRLRALPPVPHRARRLRRLGAGPPPARDGGLLPRAAPALRAAAGAGRAPGGRALEPRRREPPTAARRPRRARPVAAGGGRDRRGGPLRPRRHGAARVLARTARADGPPRPARRGGRSRTSSSTGSLASARGRTRWSRASAGCSTRACPPR